MRISRRHLRDGGKLGSVGNVLSCTGVRRSSVGHFSLGQIPPGQFPLSDNFSPAVKAKSRKMALTRTPDPNRPTRQENFWTRTPDPNRSTSINFVHVNGRSLYIVTGGWWWCTWKEKCPTPCENGNCLGWEMSGEIFQGEMSGSP